MYLPPPPKKSKYSNNNEFALNDLTIELFYHTDTDNVYICGDFNARIGNKHDIVIDEETVKRISIDGKVNQQGERLLTFLNDVSYCVTNGRTTPCEDGFTWVTSYRGRAVVDYHITRSCDITSINRTIARSCNEIIAVEGIEQLISDVSHAPDHDLLMMEVELSTTVKENLQDRNLGAKNFQGLRKTYRKVGQDYMSSEMAKRVLPQLLSKMENMVANQMEINEMYKLITLMLSEAELSANKLGKKRKSTKFKSYWDNELSKK